MSRLVETSLGRPFVGRERELTGLRAGLDAAISGRGGLVLIAGEPGIGKTRLAEELCSVADARGARVAWGRCWEGGGAPAYWPWVQILRAHMRQVDTATLAAQVGSFASEIIRLVPELARRLPEQSEPPAVGPAEERFALWEAVTELVRSASGASPLVLVLDDLHAADRASLLLLQFLGKALREMRVLVLGTYRETDAKLLYGTAELLAEAARDGIRVPLGGLEREEVAELIERATGRAPDAALVEATYGITEGNPFFTDEILRLRRGDASGTIEIPGAVRSAIARRLGFLSADAHQLLSVASVIGRDFDLATLERASATPTHRIAGLLREAATAGIVTEPATALGRSMFVHALFRESLYGELTAPERIRLHRAVATAIEGIHGAGSDAVSALAHHWHEVARGGENVDEAIEYARRAAMVEMSSLAFEEAAGHFARSLELATAARHDGTRLADLAIELGEAQWRTGDVGAAGESFLRAADLAQRAGSADRLARAALGYGSGVNPQQIGHIPSPTLIRLLEEADAALDDTTLRVRVLSRLALELEFMDRDRQEAVSARALEIADRLGEPHARLVALLARCISIWGPDRIEESLELADEILRLAGDIGDKQALYRGHQLRQKAHLTLGDFGAVERDMRGWQRVAEEIGARYFREEWESRRVHSAVREGRLEGGERIAYELVATPYRVREELRRAVGVLILFNWFVQGRFQEILIALDRMLGDLPPIPALQAWRAAMAAEGGFVAEAKTEFERIAARGFAEIPRDERWLFGMMALAIACSRLRDAKRAAILYELVSPYSKYNSTAGITGASAGSMALFVGRLAATCGRWEEALGHFEEALRTNRRAGNRPFAALALYAHAEALVTRAAAGDGQRAMALVDEALEMMRAMAMRGYIPLAEEIRGRAEALCRAVQTELSREDGQWTLNFESATYRLKDLKGLRYLAHLLARPHEEWHVLDLVVLTEGPVPGESLSAAAAAAQGLRGSRPTDAGPPLDARAKAAYRARVAALREEVEEARTRSEVGAATRAEEEMRAIANELAAAVGLRGRDRPSSAPTERARINVTRAVKAAIAEIAGRCPTLGVHLASAIRTGTVCSYYPDPRLPISARL